MKKEKPEDSKYVEFDIEGNETGFNDQVSKYKLKLELIGRLSNSKLWSEFKKHFQIKDLDEFLSNCYDHVQAYEKALQGEVDRTIKKDFGKLSIKELNKLKYNVEPQMKRSGRLRFLLRTQEKRMKGMLKNIDNKLLELGEKPKDLIFPVKPEEFTEDIICSACGHENKDSKHGQLCKNSNCNEVLGDPWKEHTICPKCNRMINRKDIFYDKVAFNLEANSITCLCGNRFDWKQYRREPRAFTTKYCIKCDKPFEPDKRNWKKQRKCPECKAKGVDTFFLDNPNYHRKYRSKKVKRK